MAYDGGPINQAVSGGGVDLFGGPAMFGMDSTGWNVATGGGNAGTSASIPWGMIALAGVAVVGLLVWKSKR